MNSKPPQSNVEAVLQYFPGEYHVVKPGGFVICAVTGKKVSIAALRYWSAELQEPYASSEIATQRYQDWKAGKLETKSSR